MTTTFMNRAAVARSVTETLGASKSLDSLASGLMPPESYMPETEGQYWQFRRYMHDILCHALIDNGTFRFQPFRLQEIGLSTMDVRLTKQQPDLFSIREDELHLGEVTFTYNPAFAINQKKERYKDLMKFLQASGFRARLDVITFDLTDPEWEESFSAISEMFKTILRDFLTSMRLIHSNPKFGNVRKSELGKYNLSRLQYSLESSTIIDQVRQATNVTVPVDYVNMAMEGPGKDMLTDEEYIERMATCIINNKPHRRPFPEPRPIEPVTMQAEFKALFDSKPTTKKLPKILQLGMPRTAIEEPKSFEESCSILRTTRCSGGYLDFIKQALFLTKPEEDDRIIRLNLPPAIQVEEQLEGPGRKAYLKRNGLKPEREVPKHIGVSPDHSRILQEFISDIEDNKNSGELKEIDFPDLSITGLTLSIELEKSTERILEHPTSKMLMFYQCISNEIVLNSMRRRSTGQYVLGYSGIRDVYFLVAPGAQLRTEHNTEFVKIISLTQPLTGGLSKEWYPVGDHWESKWVSVDVDRLKHWQRAFDRVTTTLMANVERTVRPNFTYRDGLKDELANGNYTLLALTYLENKHLTSVTNQTLRYLWMKSIGDKQFEGLAAKFPSRVNSVIQSFMLQRSVESCSMICRMPLTDLVKIVNPNRDNETGLYDETTTGVTSLLPRIFCFGGSVPIAYNLNEIYWCMAYNKDRQNAAQDALSILKKIVKEEMKYNKELAKRKTDKGKVDYFLGHTSIAEDINHAFSENPESHFYSSKAVRVGLRKQNTHPENLGDNSSWMNSDKLEAILSKPLSDYATFKASVKDIARFVNPSDLKEVRKIGVRTKAIELIAEILENEELMTASDVAMKYSGKGNEDFKILIQIFKKGQIGGVREIIILFIKARVMMNIVEEVARLLCKSDKREILTKGRDKRLMMRGDFEEVTSSFPEGTPVQVIKESYDMTVWCQKFIPVIFAHIHLEHFRDHPGMQSLAKHIFLAHSNKEIEYPRKLVEQWELHRDAKHEDPAMQSLKEKFLRDGKPYFQNHSNMCQGIPHYNSSVLGLSSISLRDALFHECLRQLNQECHIRWKTRLGSDDKGTLIGMDLSKQTSRFQAKLLGQCERVSERLHCMELSIKSASGNVMYELNSAYMANLETLSPTIKYSLAATDSIETSSCAGFVSESFARIRQMRENGCSSLICQYAHSLNSRHFYNIFSTGLGGTNDLQTVFNQPTKTIPYDFGIYPQYDSDLQDLMGPDFYNYRIFKSGDKKNKALRLLYTELSKREQDELFAREEDDLLKKDHFGITQGLVKQLAGMRERTHSKAEEVEAYFEQNPFLIIRGPQTPKEALMLVRSKLFTKGAAQALRRTSPAIYIGRLAAYKSAKAWCFSKTKKSGYDIETMEDVYTTESLKMTYLEYLKCGVETTNGKPALEFDKLLPLLYPHHKSLDVLEQIVGKFGALKSTSKRYSQAVRLWTVNNFNYEFSSGLRTILQTAFGESQDASNEDVEEFKTLINLNVSSLTAFTQDCRQRGVRPLDMFFYLTRIYKLTQSTRVQAFAHGPSSPSLHMTLLNLKRFNHIPGMVSILDSGFREEEISWANTMAGKIDKIKLLHNLIIMLETGRITQIGPNGLVAWTRDGELTSECKTILRSINSISGFDRQTQKVMTLVASQIFDNNEFKDMLIKWKSQNFTYIRRQTKTVSHSGKVSWSGDLSCLVSQANECYTLNEIRGRRFIECRSIVDEAVFTQSLRAMSRTLGMEFQSFFKRKVMSVGDYFLSDNNKTIFRCQANGVHGAVLNVKFQQNFRYRRIVDLNNFRVVKNYDEKARVLTVHLDSKEGRTATVVHSTCNYVSLELPPDTTVDPDIFYQGVRLNRLLENKNWFFNRRLPELPERELTKFFREDVHFDIVLQLSQMDQVHVKDYVEIREEVQESSFGVVHYGIETDDSTSEEKDFSQMFREAMEKEAKEATMQVFHNAHIDWAEEVQNQMEEEDETFFAGLMEEDTILAIRSFGYKRPKAQKSAHTISSLQQGAELRLRILDSFFRMYSVKSEPSRMLPCYYSWLHEQLGNGQTMDNLIEQLKEHIITALWETTGTKKKSIKESLERTHDRIMKSPLKAFYNLINVETDMLTQDEVLDDLFKQSDDYQEVLTDDDDLYE